MMRRKRPRSTQDKKAESMGQSRRAGGRVRSWRDPRADLAAAADKTIAIPLVFCERAFRGQVCALHEGARDVRTSHPGSRNVSRLSPSLPFASTLCLLSPVSHPLVLTVSSFRVTREEWFPFVCPVGPTPAHVYRRRESDTFARMLQARESSEKKKGLLLDEILPDSNSMTPALFFSFSLDRVFLVMNILSRQIAITII